MILFALRTNPRQAKGSKNLLKARSGNTFLSTDFGLADDNAALANDDLDDENVVPHHREGDCVISPFKQLESYKVAIQNELQADSALHRRFQTARKLRYLRHEV